MSEPIYSIPPDLVRHDDLIVALGATPWTRKPEVMQPIWDAGINGKDQVCINLDTGFRKHVDLPEPIAVRNFTGGSASDVTDRHGHGNHTIGSAVGRNGIGAAPEAQLKVGKVLGDSGSGSNTVAGLNWAAEQEGDVVSCSWGGGGSVDSSTEAALRRIVESGKWVVFAAGNSGYNGRNTVIAPGLSPTVICVSSINSDETLSGFSSGGPRVDLAAGGGQIISAGLKNDRVLMSGTSMATPTAAGDLLLLRQMMKKLGMKVTMNMRELVTFLKSEEFLKDAGPVGRDPRFGDGIITSKNIITWINNKLKDLVVVFALAMCVMGGSAMADGPFGFDVPQVDLPSRQATFLRAAAASIVEADGKVLILAEGLEDSREYAVVLTVPEKYTWVEIHEETKPFPPRVQKPSAKLEIVVTGQPKQAFWVSLRNATDPPVWVRTVVAPEIVVPNPPPPIDPVPPKPGLFDDIRVKSAEFASKLDKPTAATIKSVLTAKLDQIERDCKAGRCWTLEAAKSGVVTAINDANKSGSVDWYWGWRKPISDLVNAYRIVDTPTYVAAMRAAAAGL